MSADYRLLPNSEVESCFREFSEGVWQNRLPNIKDIPLVNDPASILSYEERIIIDSGEEDMIIRATFDKMPDPLRYALRFGYSIELAPWELTAHNHLQFEWMSKAAWFLGRKHSRMPTKTEFYEDFYGRGTALFFNIRKLLLNRDRAEARIDFQMVHGMPMLDSLYGGPDELHSRGPSTSLFALAA